MEKNVTYNFKRKIQSGEKVFGPLIGPGNDPGKTVEALKRFGYDFIILDNEHVLINEETVYGYIHAATETGIPVLMRPKDKTAIVRCYLDAGINGLVVPQVNSLKETLQAVNQAYFPPIGHRGYGIGESPYLIDFMSPREHSFLSLTEYVNNNTVVFPMTESLENISNLARILQLDFQVISFHHQISTYVLLLLYLPGRLCQVDSFAYSYNSPIVLIISLMKKGAVNIASEGQTWGYEIKREHLFPVYYIIEGDSVCLTNKRLKTKSVRLPVTLKR